MSALAVLAVVVTVAANAPAQVSASGDDPSSDPARLVFLLQYIGTDYGVAVRDGKVANAFEYAEISGFTRLLLRSARRLSTSEETRKGLRELQSSIHTLRPWPEVLAIVNELVQGVTRERGLRSFPLEQPDLQRGGRLYDSDCAVCHGARGGGDGRAASWQDPAPSSFREERMNLVSPYQVYGAASFGIEGTAMPSYAGARSEQELWDVAFHVMTLREDFAPQEPTADVPIDLASLARHANQELFQRAGDAGSDLTLSAVDFYRLHPPAPDVHAMASDLGRTTAPADKAPAADLDVAVSLQTAFEEIAERTFPSIVGITIYQRGTADASRSPPGATAGWRAAGAEHDRHPGYRAIGQGSGFFVTDDGYVLTCRHLLIDPETHEVAELIELEVTEERHERARVVGLEPTINLAVLKVELPFESQPARLGDISRMRSGHWVIAVGNPPGPDKIFAPGTASERPQRECYQEQRIATLLQVSLRIPPSSYGGPLLDIRGEVIGISTPRDAAVGPEADATFGQAYGLPIDLAMTLFEPLRLRESQRSPWIGISVLSLSGEVRRRLAQLPVSGVYIDDVFDPSPAAHAGLKVGDVLTRIDQQPMFSVHHFQKALYLASVGQEIALELYRDGKTFTRKVVIEQRPPTATTR